MMRIFPDARIAASEGYWGLTKKDSIAASRSPTFSVSPFWSAPFVFIKPKKSGYCSMQQLEIIYLLQKFWIKRKDRISAI